jgi:hypothetical protein
MRPFAILYAEHADSTRRRAQREQFRSRSTLNAASTSQNGTDQAAGHCSVIRGKPFDFREADGWEKQGDGRSRSARYPETASAKSQYMCIVEHRLPPAAFSTAQIVVKHKDRPTQEPRGQRCRRRRQPS